MLGHQMHLFLGVPVTDDPAIRTVLLFLVEDFSYYSDIEGSRTSSDGKGRGTSERSLLAERLHARQAVACRAILDRLHSMEEGSPTRDAEYLKGLREAVHRGVEYGVNLIAEGRYRGSDLPLPLITQARLAARQRIPLETVLRRYSASRTVFGDFILGEAAAAGIQDPSLLREAMAAQEAAFDSLLKLVAEEYKREESIRGATGDSRTLAQLRQILAGGWADWSAIDYDLDGHHLGLVTSCPDGRRIIRRIASETGSRALIVDAPEGEAWAWLGSKEPLDPDAVRALATSAGRGPVGIGEPTQSLAGWRLTHRQAQLALTIAQASASGIARYADVAIIANAAQDHVMSTSLEELYLLPLNCERNRGRIHRETLRAYFSVNRNSKSAAAALGVSRQTVTNRLRQVEDRIGQPLSKCGDSLDVALKLEELSFLAVN